MNIELLNAECDDYLIIFRSFNHEIHVFSINFRISTIINVNARKSMVMNGLVIMIIAMTTTKIIIIIKIIIITVIVIIVLVIIIMIIRL